MPSTQSFLPQVEASLNHLTAATRLYQAGGKTSRSGECFVQKIESGDFLVASLDWRQNGTVPVITVAREDGLDRMTLDQILASPEIVPAICEFLDESFRDLLSLPTGQVDGSEVCSEPKVFNNPDFGDIRISTCCAGLRRDLMVSQDGVGKLILHPVHVQFLAQGLKNALEAFEAKPYC